MRTAAVSASTLRATIVDDTVQRPGSQSIARSAEAPQDERVRPTLLKPQLRLSRGAEALAGYDGSVGRG